MSLTGCGMNPPMTFSSGLSDEDEHPRERQARGQSQRRRGPCGGSRVLPPLTILGEVLGVVVGRGVLAVQHVPLVGLRGERDDLRAVHRDDRAVLLLLRRVDADADLAGALDGREVAGETDEGGGVLCLEPAAEGGGGVSRSGSVVTKTTRSLSWSAFGRDFLATAMLLMMSGQTSGGQLV